MKINQAMLARKKLMRGFTPGSQVQIIHEGRQFWALRSMVSDLWFFGDGWNADDDYIRTVLISE